jgi:YegS/Rv2252/BmrU family lipid kinase
MKQAASGSYEIIETTGPGDAMRIAREHPLPGNPDETVFVAAGGDGTCSEVANGLILREADPAKRPLYGVLPVGRGNDFAYNCGVGEDLEAALQLLVTASTVPLDAGLVIGENFPTTDTSPGRYFVNGVGIGFDTKVGFAAAKMKIQTGFSYALGAIVTIARWEEDPLLELQYGEDKVTEPLAIVSVMNGIRMGGSFHMTPKAKMDDGVFDICAIKHPSSRRRLIRIVAKYPSGKQIFLKEAIYGKAADVHIKALKGGMAAHADGETVCTEGTELTLKCLPHALRLISAGTGGAP